MRYRELPPSPQLRSAVVCHWTTCTGAHQASVRRAIYPDGCFDLLLVLGGDVVREGERDALRGAFVVGPMTRAASVVTGAGADIVGVRFRPGPAARMLGIPLVELRDAHMPARELLGRKVNELADRLASTRGFAPRSRVLDGVLSAWLGDRGDDTAGALLQRVHWGERVSAVAEHLGLSERQVQRIFLRDVGLTPTEVVRLRRFRRAMERLGQLRGAGLSAIALELGYSDHAHFTREFTAFAGRPPSTFLRAPRAGPPASDLFKRV
jgi:AraC-like DNA-binding protein